MYAETSTPHPFWVGYIKNEATWYEVLGHFDAELELVFLSIRKDCYGRRFIHSVRRLLQRLERRVRQRQRAVSQQVELELGQPAEC